MVAYGGLLTPQVLTLGPGTDAVNLHFSLLPRWRGASRRAACHPRGGRITGVSVMHMDEGLDTGPVLARREEPIHDDDDAGSLGARLAAIGGALLVGTLGLLARDRATPRLRTPAPATSAPKLRPHDRVIDWTRTRGAVDRRVRAFAPDPGATTTFRGEGAEGLAGRAHGRRRPRAAPGAPS